MSDVSSSLDLRNLSINRKQVGQLDPEIAGEGQKVILSDGEQVSWQPPPPNPVVPDISRIKSIAHYFRKTGFQVYPAWLYHPTEPARVVKNADEAGQLGVFYRKATIDERGRYGVESTWDWDEDCLWRPKPYQVEKFDPNKPGHGKFYQPTPPNPKIAQNELIESLIPAVAAAVAQSLKSEGPGKPAKIADGEWDEFLQFKAWKQAQATVEKVVEIAAEDAVGEPVDNALNSDQDRAVWLAEAERKGVKVDKRWGLERLKEEILKAA